MTDRLTPQIHRTTSALCAPVGGDLEPDCAAHYIDEDGRIDMRSTRRIAVGSMILAVGSGLISLASLESIRPGWIVDLPKSAFEALILIGTTAIILGILLILSNFIYVPVLTTKRPRCRPVKRDELELLHDFSEQFFPGSFSLNGAKALFRLNKKMLLVVWRERAKVFSHGFERQMIGFFSLLPLNREAKKLLEANEFESEHISSDYVLKTYEGAEAIYLGGVAAGIGSRAQVLAHLVLHLLDLAGQGHKCIYSRPTGRKEVPGTSGEGLPEKTAEG